MKLRVEVQFIHVLSRLYTKVLFIQPGFAMLEAGFVGATNTLNILSKNLCAACTICIEFWLLGYGMNLRPVKLPKCVYVHCFLLLSFL